MNKLFTDDTIAAVSTPVGEGGIGIVRLSGKDATGIADRLFISANKIKPSQFESHTVHYGYIIEKAPERRSAGAQERKIAKVIKIKNNVVDEALVAVMKAPKTYTREDVVEINCHGGMTALRKVMELAVKHGARIAEPGEFTKRAFLNGRIDLAQAEAVIDVIRAKTDASLRVSVNQLNGELSREVNSIRNDIIDICAGIEASIDFPEENIEIEARKIRLNKIKIIKKRLKKLADTYREGAILKDGITAVICGRTNVGKSSLMNLLLKRDRVIVAPMPGTTRDAIEEMVNIKGIPIRLVDTAGIRKQNNIVEKAGIEKSRLYISNADLILCVLDGSDELKKDDTKLLRDIAGKCAIIIINKCDLKINLNIKKIKQISKNNNIIKISCLEREGIDRLEEAVYNKVWSGRISLSHQLLLNNVRHKDAIDLAVLSIARAEDGIRERLPLELLSVDIKEAVNALGVMTGSAYSDDILNVIFSKFCIGK